MVDPDDSKHRILWELAAVVEQLTDGYAHVAAGSSLRTNCKKLLDELRELDPKNYAEMQSMRVRQKHLRFDAK